MQFQGEFRVPGRPDEVLGRFADVERMVCCMPGASIEGRGDDGRYLGAMVVAFGPKKIKFRGKIACAVDPDTRTGRLHVRGAAELRATARVEVHVVYSIRDDPAAATPTSIVNLTSDAEMGGVLADFARTGGVAVTRTLMESFAACLADEFRHDVRAATAPDAQTEPAPLSRQPQSALSVRRMLWAMVKSRLSALGAWLRFLLQRT